MKFKLDFECEDLEDFVEGLLEDVRIDSQWECEGDPDVPNGTNEFEGYSIISARFPVVIEDILREGLSIPTKIKGILFHDVDEEGLVSEYVEIPFVFRIDSVDIPNKIAIYEADND